MDFYVNACYSATKVDRILAMPNYKVVDVEHIRTDIDNKLSRVRFRINGVEEWIDIDYSRQDGHADGELLDDFSVAIVQELERLFNKVLAR